MNRQLREYIQQGHIIITASQRQARYLKHAHASEMINDGKTAWLTPDILTWKSWVRLSWDEHQLMSQSLLLVLNASQVRTIWQSIIDSSPSTKSILQKK